MSNYYDFIFRDAWEARDKITKRQEREIRKLYNKWAREVREQANQLSKIGTPESARQSRELAKLYYQLRSASKQLTAEINTSIKDSIEYMANAVTRCNKIWLKNLGFTDTSIDTKFSLNRDMAIRNIITGNIYTNGYSLSQRLWQIEKNTMKDIYSIVAKGIAQNMSIYDISKLLEKYIRPDAKIPYTMGVHQQVTDYSAQRLARTLIQHTYQQTLVALTKDNPYVNGYIWHANGAHSCELCEERDGQVYSADDLPLDHPNGMCSMEPYIDLEKMIREVSDWESELGNMYDFFQDLDFRPSMN
ncbi:MAG: hypothetical protein K2N51_15000 [Lachnospiraceae bacterium]|nr:hypothetical protein [Lachnospiraceae bacterium]